MRRVSLVAAVAALVAALVLWLSASDGPSRAGGRKGGRKSSTHEIVSGRNSVLEALRTGVPVTTVYLAARLESDDRTR